MDYTLRQLQGFLAVAELGSFTRAAERMRLTQSAMSVLVAELERSLRLRLLDRTTRRVELTDAGMQFRAAASKAVADLDHAVRNAHLLADRVMAA
jgi:DNA-binding transcriptional LysR family regulator